MDNVSIEGQWWLPQSPTNRVPGIVTLDGSGLSLVVDEQLDELDLTVIAPGWPPAETVRPIVHGTARGGGNVTLLEVEGTHVLGPVGPNTQDFEVHAVVEGEHLVADAFTEAVFQFDLLSSWVDPDGIVTANPDGTMTVPALGMPSMASAVIGGDKLDLLVGVAGEAGTSSVHVERTTAFSLEFQKPLTLAVIVTDRVRPLQDLLTILLGRPVCLTSLRFRSTTGTAPGEFCDIRLQLLQAVQPSGASTAMLMGFGSPTLLMYKQLTANRPFKDLMPDWFELRSELLPILNTLLSPFYGSFMYHEHHFSTTYQSAEAYARKRHAGRQKTKPEHRRRVADVADVLATAKIPLRRSRARVSRIPQARRYVRRRGQGRRLDRALDPETLKWATAVLRDRNDKTLTEMMTELLEGSGDFGGRILAANPSFASVMATDRGGMFHGAGKKSVSTPQRHWNTEALRWVLRARIVEDLGIDRAQLNKAAAKRALFRRAVKEIQKTATP